MNYRQAVILASKSLAADTVETLNLKGLDPLSELLVLYRARNNLSVPTEHPAAGVLHVKVLDGSEVVCDLTGYEADALQYWHYKRPTLSGVNYINDNWCWVALRIPFGRWLWDSELALDPARFSNLQVIVEIDLSAGGSNPDAATLMVAAHVFDQKKISPVGYLKSRRHYTYLGVSSGIETVNLPTDLPIKTIMFQSIARTKAPNSQFNRIKITEDNDKKVAFDMPTSDLIKLIQAEYPPIIEKIRANSTVAAVAHFVTPCYEEDMVLSAILGAPDYYDTVPGYGGEIFVDAQTGGEVCGIVHGWCPHGSVAIEMGDPWDMNDWFTPRQGGALQALLTAGSAVLATTNIQVILQQLKKYGG